MSDEEKSGFSSPKVYLLPNMLTAGNLFCGFLAILMIFDGMKNPDYGALPYYKAIALILGACLFDLLDGRVARMRGQESLFGREFDSLADIVSFGVAPALLVMDIVLTDFSHRLGWIIAFIYLLCGGMRLARFNCIAAEDKESTSRNFVGFPIPAAAGLIASLTLFMLWLNEGDKTTGAWRYVLLFLMLLLSFLMLSEFSYPSFKRINVGTRRSLPWVFVSVVVFLCAVVYWQIVPAILFTSYLIYGCLRPWISRRWRREIEEGDEPDLHLEEAELSDREGNDQSAA